MDRPTKQNLVEVKAGENPRQVLMDAKQKRQDDFLVSYLESGSIPSAAHVVGVSPSTITNWRREPSFAKAFLSAREALGRKLEGAVYKRALEGVERGVYFEGALVATEREYDVRREQLALRALLPDDYGAKLDIDIRTRSEADLRARLAHLLAPILEAEYTVAPAEQDHVVEPPDAPEPPPG